MNKAKHHELAVKTRLVFIHSNQVSIFFYKYAEYVKYINHEKFVDPKNEVSFLWQKKKKEEREENKIS